MIVYPKNVVWPFWDIADELVEELAEPEPAGLLRVQVYEAKELVNVDVVGKSDPYATLRVGDEEHKTQVMKDNLNPVWNEVFEFVVHDKETGLLKINVVDQERFGKHEPVGYTVYLRGLEKGLENCYKDVSVLPFLACCVVLWFVIQFRFAISPSHPPLAVLRIQNTYSYSRWVTARLRSIVCEICALTTSLCH